MASKHHFHWKNREKTKRFSLENVRARVSSQTAPASIFDTEEYIPYYTRMYIQRTL
jgi:hypothetical protein